MKSSPLVICALLGAAQAIVKHTYVFDDHEQYQDDGIKAFMEKNTNNLVSDADAAKANSTAAFVPVNKPNPIPNLSAKL